MIRFATAVLAAFRIATASAAEGNILPTTPNADYPELVKKRQTQV